MAQLDPEFLKDVFATFGEYLALDELKAVMEQSFVEAIRAAVSGKTRAEVLQLASEKAAELVKGIGDQMRQQLAEKIAYGLEQQLGPDGTARLLRDGLDLDGPRAKRLEKYRESLVADGLSGDALEAKVKAYHADLAAERAEVIARTEMGRAIEGGAFDNAKAGGATHKVWVTVGDARVRESCVAAQAQGPIPVEKPFHHGLQYPGEPNCRCTCSYVTDTGKGELDRAAERARARDEALKAARAAEEETEE